MRVLSLFALAVLATSLLGAEIPEAVDKAAIPNYRRIRPGLAAAGQPSPEAIARLKEVGFKTVINLRTEKEGGKAQEQSVAPAGRRSLWGSLCRDTLSPGGRAAVAPRPS